MIEIPSEIWYFFRMRKGLYYWIILCCFCSAAMAQDLSTPKAVRKAQRYQ